jgi:2Fe-2S ferredoxin
MGMVTFIAHDGSSQTLDIPDGTSLMHAAILSGVPDILGECGGSQMCATCHVYVAQDWLAKTGTQSAMEESMLDFAENVESNSRLSCQIKISDELDGLIVNLPESQH